MPESKNQDGVFDSITVVIDLLTAMVHLVPSRINYNACQISELVFDEIYKLHGLPKYIVSDRDVIFTSTFWSNLHKLVGTKLRMSKHLSSPVQWIYRMSQSNSYSDATAVH